MLSYLLCRVARVGCRGPRLRLVPAVLITTACTFGIAVAERAGPRVTFDTSAASDPTFVAFVERLRRAAEAGDTATVRAAIAADFRMYALSSGSYLPDARIGKDKLIEGEGDMYAGIYGLFLPETAGPAETTGQDPELTRQKERKAEEQFIRERDQRVAESINGWFGESPVGRVRQMRSATCLPADPVLPPLVLRKIFATKDKEFGAVTSSYAYALHPLVVTDKPTGDTVTIANLTRYQILELGYDKKHRGTPVTLADGRKGWIASTRADSDVRRIFDKNFMGVCFGKVGGEWKITSGAVIRL